jgi:hypothetical protein
MGDALQPALPGGRPFPSAEAAAQALVAAAAADDVKALLEILGPAFAGLVSANPVADSRIRHDFAAQAAQKMRLVAQPGRQNEMTLLTGPKEWPLPVRIVELNGKWYFATGQSGRRRKPER